MLREKPVNHLPSWKYFRNTTFHRGFLQGKGSQLVVLVWGPQKNFKNKCQKNKIKNACLKNKMKINTEFNYLVSAISLNLVILIEYKLILYVSYRIKVSLFFDSLLLLKHNTKITQSSICQWKFVIFCVKRFSLHYIINNLNKSVKNS